MLCEGCGEEGGNHGADCYELDIEDVDYEPSVCDNCGRDEHTEVQLAACVDSMLDDTVMWEEGDM